MAIGPDLPSRRPPARLAPGRALVLAMALMVEAAAPPGLAAERTGPAGRYDRQLFVCRSIDPTDSRLNLRSAPAGPVIDTISRRERFYVRGGDLRLTPAGWVPVHARQPASASTAPMGWVWKAFISCELIDRPPAGGNQGSGPQGSGQVPRPQSA